MLKTAEGFPVVQQGSFHIFPHVSRFAHRCILDKGPYSYGSLNGCVCMRVGLHIIAFGKGSYGLAAAIGDWIVK
jgi:hypothetical protein